MNLGRFGVSGSGRWEFEAVVFGISCYSGRFKGICV